MKTPTRDCPNLHSWQELVILEDARMYLDGTFPPRYPMPAIIYQVDYVYVRPNDPFNAVTIRDGAGWMVYGMAEDGELIGAARMSGQCPLCGGFHRLEECPF